MCLAILGASDDAIATVQNELFKLTKEIFKKQSYIKDLFPRLQDRYSNEDSRNLIALLQMNYRILSRGKSFHVPADGIHAWVSGGIIGCVARLDKGFNTGFRPRADRDSVETFCKALTFQSHSIDEAMLPPRPSAKSMDSKTKEYASPMSEFNMLLTRLKIDEADTVKPVKGPSIMIVTKKSGLMTVEDKSYKPEEGYIFFVGQGVEVIFETQKELEVYRA